MLPLGKGTWELSALVEVLRNTQESPIRLQVSEMLLPILL